MDFLPQQNLIVTCDRGFAGRIGMIVWIGASIYLEGLSGPGLSHGVWVAWKSCRHTSAAQT